MPRLGATDGRGRPPAHRFGPILLIASLIATFAMATAGASLVAAADPVVAAAGDYGCDPGDVHYNGGVGTIQPDYCQEKLTSDQLVAGGYAGVLALGDQHWCGSLAEYQQAYDPTWGRLKSITHPVPGNHEYITAGTTFPTTGCDASNKGAAGYFNYYGSAAGTAGQGWYSYNVGAWHVIALNSSCGQIGGCGVASAEGTWLAADLAAHPNQCTLAYWHIPLFSSGGRASPDSRPFWQQLYAAHADIVLDGHDHIYERFDQQDPNGVADPNGIREFIVGTGGANHTGIAGVAANSAVRNTNTFGVLALTLHSHSYSWSFLPGLGTFTDSGTATCHNSGIPPTPTPTPGPTTTFNPIADAYVDNSHPTVNYGKNAQLRVDASPLTRSYLRFNVSGLSGKVVSATLRLYANTGQLTGYDVYSVADSTWGETTITDANAPPFGSKLGSSGRVTAATWTQVAVTGAVPASGLVTFGISTTNSTALTLASRETTYGPQLVVVTNGSTSSPTATPTATPTPTVTPTPTPTVTPTPTPTPGALNFVATADSWVDASLSSTNYGTSTQLRVDGSPVLRSYLKFTVTGTSGNVGSAVLWVYANSAQSTGYDVFGVPDSTWTETGITNDNAPAFGAKLGSSGKAQAGTWLSVNVTSFVNGDGTVSFGLSTTNSTALSLSSRQGANAPYLLVYPGS